MARKAVELVHLIKRFSYAETRYAAVLVGLLLGCVLWLTSLAGLFAVPDGVLYDYLSGSSVSSTRDQPNVLLLEVDPELRDAGDDSWLSLLRELQTQGAAQVLFTFMPTGVSRDFYIYANKSAAVFFGRRPLASFGALSDMLTLELPPKSAQGIELLMATYAIAPSEYGVYRRQSYSFSSEGQPSSASLEAMAAVRNTGLASAGNEQPPFMVNFLGGASGLPRISATRVLKGELIPELVKGRSVLIGMADSGQALFTPLAKSGKLLSELEFHGYALDTLLRDKTIWAIPLWVAFPLILILIGASLFVFQWGGLRFSASLTVVLVVIYTFFAWLMLNFGGAWLPLAELWAAQIATFMVFTRYRAVNEESKLRQLVLETNGKLRDRFFLASFASSSEHWSQVITMVNQTLNLERVIFLERIKDDHRVREVKSLNCSLQDIKELRRDYERAPYSTAIAEGHLIEVKGYLTQGIAGEIQCLVPLLFGGEVLGFWAFSADPEKLAALHNRDAVLRNFAEQIAELLFHRQQAQEREAKQSRPMQRYLRLQGGEQLAESLKKTLTALDRRLVGMEDYMDGLSTAGILYDLFGRVVVANQQMVQLLSESQLAPYQMTAVDLISEVAGVDLDYARGLMQNIILDRHKISLPVKLGSDERSFVLHLGPLLPAQGKQKLREGDPLPFEVEGVLCELIDVTSIKRLGGLKDDVVKRVTTQIRSDSEALLTGISLLETEGLTDEKRSRVLNIIREKIVDLVSVTDRADDLLSMEFDTGAVECYPIDCKHPLLAALESVRGKATNHDIQFDLQLPELVSLVFASPDGLQAVLESILDVEVSDTVQQGHIKVTLQEKDGWVVYHFSNQGFGMPDERFQDYLHGDLSRVTEEFKALRNSAIRVGHWEGALNGTSEIGVGSRFELKLKGFI